MEVVDKKVFPYCASIFEVQLMLGDSHTGCCTLQLKQCLIFLCRNKITSLIL